MTICHNHHISPRHVGGSDDPSNLVKLTVGEHADVRLQLYEKHGLTGYMLSRDPNFKII